MESSGETQNKLSEAETVLVQILFLISWVLLVFPVILVAHIPLWWISYGETIGKVLLYAWFASFVFLVVVGVFVMVYDFCVRTRPRCGCRTRTPVYSRSSW